MSFHFPEKNLSKQSEFFDSESPHSYKSSALSIADSKSSLLGACGGLPSSSSHSGIVRKSKPRNLSLPDENMVINYHESLKQAAAAAAASENKDEEVDGNPLRLLRQNKTPGGTTNVLPLPPRDKNKSIGINSFSSSNARHQRKHPLLIPSKISIASSSTSADMPPPPPPKPVRQQYLRVQESTMAGNENSLNGNSSSSVSKTRSSPERSVERQINPVPVSVSCSKTTETSSDTQENETPSRKSSVVSNNSTSSIEEKSSSATNNGDKIPFYENYDNLDSTVEQLISSKETRENGSIISGADESPKSTGKENLSSSGSQIHNASIHQRVRSLDLSSSSSSIEHTRSNNEDTKSIYEEPVSFTPTPAPRTSILNRNEVDPAKVRTVRRILGSSATEQESEWAVLVTQDSAHAVKLLRLKSLLPDDLISDDIERVVSVLEMSHWDVARAASFLLDNTSKSKGVVKVKYRSEASTSGTGMSEYSSTSSLSNGSFSSSDSSNNNNTASASSIGSNGTNCSNSKERTGTEYVRPTRV
jgi:hypothetical protein